MTYDAVVLGLGVMGAAALRALARRGLRVLGLERFEPGHDRGSSHGETRIVRLVQFFPGMDPAVPRRALDGWDALERETGARLLERTGCVFAGPPGHFVPEGARAFCVQHGLPHDDLDAGALAERFPGFRLPAGARAIVQPDGGFVRPEAAVAALLRDARAHGAEARAGTRVLGWEPDGAGLRVRTDSGDVAAGRLVVAAGSWTGTLLPRLAPLLRPERQVLVWFRPRVPELFAPDRFPVFVIAHGDGRCYGFPSVGKDGVKVARFGHRGEPADPERPLRETGTADEAPARAFVEAVLPDAAGPTTRMKTCFFTHSPDGDMILDRLPEEPRVCFAAGFSGSGFKFAPVVGEALADLAEGRALPPELRRFGLARLA